MVNFEKLKNFIDKNSQKVKEHVLWNEFDDARSRLPKIVSKFVLAELDLQQPYNPQQLYYLLLGKDLQDNVELVRTCNIVNCIAHFEEKQFNLESVVEMSAFDTTSYCARFVKLCCPKDDITGCIEWNGYVNSNGYGKVSFLNKPRQAHAVAWELANGEDIPSGNETRHMCDNKLCVNPDHLTVGTHQQNMQDQVDKGLILRGEQHKRASISEATAKMIINSFNNGKSVNERCTEFHTTKGVIHPIDRAESWRYLMTPKQIIERESLRNNVNKHDYNKITDDTIKKIKESKLTAPEYAKINNLPLLVVTNIRKSSFKSATEKKEIMYKNVLDKIIQNSTMFYDPSTQTNHLLYENNASQAASEKSKQIRYLGKKQIITRVVYMATKKIDSLPKIILMRHKCRFKHCVSFECLEPGSHQENMDDMKRDGTSRQGEKHAGVQITEDVAIKIKQTKGVCSQPIRAVFFNTTLKIIANIDSGKNWKHLRDEYEESPELISELMNFALQQNKGKKRPLYQDI